MSRRSGHYTRVDLDEVHINGGSTALSGSSSSSSGSSIPATTSSTHHPITRSRRLLLFISLGVLLFLITLLHHRHAGGAGIATIHDINTKGSTIVHSTISKVDLKKWSSPSKNKHNGLSKVFGGSSSRLDDKRITLIAMWDNDNNATYLPSFFRSAARNADAVDLLWINVMRSEESSCLDVSPYTEGATNIKTLCISNKQDRSLIRNYLCSIWQCTESEVEKVDFHLLNERLDPIHCEFKPLRGGIYRQWIRTKWWAWVDADQLVGNFKDLWPWHMVDNFDVITISEWDIGNIYLRGQFTAFQTSNPKTDKIWTKYPPLSSPSSLETLPHGPLDEFEYSVLYSNTLKDDVNWLLIPRLLGADKFGGNKLVSNGKRVFYVPVDMRRRDVTMTLDERYNPKGEVGFAAVEAFDPEKWAVPVKELGKGDFVYEKPIWDWCVQPETRCTVMRESYWYSSALMRWKGQLLEYFDLRSHPRASKREIFFGIEEKLFIHFQEIKRRKWFKLPPNGVLEDDILEIREDSVVMWDKHTLETKFEAVNPAVAKPLTPTDELLAHGYWGINGTDEMPLPVGVHNALLER